MNRTFCHSVLSITAMIAVAGTLAFAQSEPTKTPTKPKAPTAPTAQDAKDAAGEHMPQLPPGWTAADMQACVEAGTPGENHAKLAECIGTWQGKNKMWMAPGTEPMMSESTTTISSMMDGRFTKCEVAGEIPGMGPFNGFGIYGYDNVSKKYQSTWIDNCGTAIMTGTGELSSDGKTMTWNYNYTCPITKKATTMREVDRTTGKDTKTMEMYTIDPKSGKEYKMMEVAMTRTGGATRAVSAPTGGH